MNGYFITSTDTNVGKTTVALSLMKYLKAQGKIVGCMKPVSAGCEATPEGLRNEDALQLIKEASMELPYDQVNPYAFAPPIAPHIAAQQTGVFIDTNIIAERYKEIASKSEVVVVEGAGGWLVPVNDHQSMADIAASLNTSVILVVGMKLGCLNHALLTAASITDAGVPFAGWIANQLENNMLEEAKNIEALKLRIQAPFIGSVTYGSRPSERILNLADNSVVELTK